MLIGREKEQEYLRSAFQADRSRFIAVYGRRRVGKTFLIRETFDYSFTFEHAGLAKGKYRDQLNAFAASLTEAGAPDVMSPKNWMEAFRQLKKFISESQDKRKVIFIDELSWMDTPRSDLVMALENFWNGFASARKDIVLIICTSATSWILKTVIHDKGGLHNRVTDKIPLQPFNLYECERFLESKNIVMDRYDILEGYMAMGGVPYYWDFIQSGKSMTQNIDAMFFDKDALLKGERTISRSLRLWQRKRPECREGKFPGKRILHVMDPFPIKLKNWKAVDLSEGITSSERRIWERLFN